jgi:hypothetical protein
MHLIALREIIRDADVAGAIRPVIIRHHMSLEDTASASGVPRAGGVARNHFHSYFPPGGAQS